MQHLRHGEFEWPMEKRWCAVGHSVNSGQICSCRMRTRSYHAGVVLSIVDRHVPALAGIVTIGK